MNDSPLRALRHHVTGAVERGEAEAIAGVPAKPLPKSLHTVTVLVAVGRTYLSSCEPNHERNVHNAIATALRVLGYGIFADNYGLASKAAAILSRLADDRETQS